MFFKRKYPHALFRCAPLSGRELRCSGFSIADNKGEKVTRQSTTRKEKKLCTLEG